MRNETTLPPVKQSRWLRAWNATVRLVHEHPDKALLTFLVLLAVAVIL